MTAFQASIDGNRAARPLDASGIALEALAGEPRIRAHQVTRKFDTGKQVVDALGPLNLDIKDGEFLSIVGPSGCGKSTFLRVLAGLIHPTSGDVTIQLRDQKRTLMATVFQDSSIYGWKTVEQNVRFGLELRSKKDKDKKSKAERDAIVAGYLERLGLTDFAKAYPATLSGGMRQRVSIARALAVEPEILLMDEPFAALDAQLRTILQDELVQLWETDRRTVVFITHSIDEALFLSDRVVVMTARPGQVRAEFEMPFPRPRSHEIRGTAEFAMLQEEVWEVLRDEVDRYLHERQGQPTDR